MRQFDNRSQLIAQRRAMITKAENEAALRMMKKEEENVTQPGDRQLSDDTQKQKDFSASGLVHRNDIKDEKGEAYKLQSPFDPLMTQDVNHEKNYALFPNKSFQDSIRNEEDIENLSVFFPFANINITDDIVFIEIYQINGKKITSGAPYKDKRGNYQFKLNDIKTGLYLVIMKTIKDKEEVGKFFVFDESSNKNPFILNFVKTPATEGYVSMERTGEYHPARSFVELIDLVRIAEKKLKLSGQDVRTRIKTLRGIYYGTEWSFDYKKAEGSAMRNLGFTYFLYGDDAMFTANNAIQKILGNTNSVSPNTKYIPVNPISVLGKDLFDALFNSFEIKDPLGRMIDFGHFIIGLEARLSKENSQERAELEDPRSFSSSPMGGTGLELTTWVGDLGGGAGLLAQKKTENPNTDPLVTVFGDDHSYGAAINLEGDIAAFVSGLGENDNTPYGLILDEDTGIAGLLVKYLSYKPDQPWENRAKKFLSLYGGKFSSFNRLINYETIVLLFTEKIKRFAYFYKETRIKDEINKKQSVNKLTDEQEKKANEQMEKISAQIPWAANNVAILFVRALLNAVKNPDTKIAP